MGKLAFTPTNSIVTNTIGTTTATGEAKWTFVLGVINHDWDGVDIATIADPTGVLPANTYAVANTNDPIFFYLNDPGTILSFQVSLREVELNITPGTDGYYLWKVQFGTGDTPGKNVIFTRTGGEDFSAAGYYTPSPGMVVSYSNSSLPTGGYWMTAELTVGVEKTGPSSSTIPDNDYGERD